MPFQSTSSEEDVVSRQTRASNWALRCFNPRPPKRTLCLEKGLAKYRGNSVSIHVLRRGRCVQLTTGIHGNDMLFQSTSSEEDVVSSDFNFIRPTVIVSIHVLRRGRCVNHVVRLRQGLWCFNPRPPKRTLCLVFDFRGVGKCNVSIHVLRRGRCVLPGNTSMRDGIIVSIHVLRRGRCVKIDLSTFTN